MLETAIKGEPMEEKLLSPGVVAPRETSPSKVGVKGLLPTSASLLGLAFLADIEPPGCRPKKFTRSFGGLAVDSEPLQACDRIDLGRGPGFTGAGSED